MKNKIISVIIPTYNIQDYLDCCLHSFEDKELLDNIEILIVNDGSTDDSMKVAEKYKKKYPNSYCVINKENGGHGSTINTSLAKAHGKYIMVVDGDDWIESKNLLYICSFLRRHEDYDAVFFDYIMELKYKKKSKRRTLKHIFHSGDINIKKAKMSIYRQIGLANTLYKTSNLKEIGLRLLEKTFYVDAEYMLYPMNTIKKAYYFNIPVYHYLIGRPSQSTNLNTALSRIDDRIRVIRRIIETFKEKEKYNDFALKCYYTKTASIINDYYELLIKGDSNFDEKIKVFDQYLLEEDATLFDFVSKKYMYVEKARKSGYNKRTINIYYKINKIIIYLKKR